MPLRHPVPPDLIDKVKLDDMAEIRIIVGEDNTMLQENLMLAIKQESAEDFPEGPGGIKAYPVLAISGGGANGAYGAGLLKGWSREGSRPVFKIVTGVSTGAIIASFAFLGKEYDSELEIIYTTMSTKDVMTSRGLFGPIFGNSAADNRPLARILASKYGSDILDKIVVQHKRGRRLFVGTVNLDAQRFVIWDMGAIASRGDVELFRNVILASAAIPVTFPPVFFHVNADGKSYDEMHVDGGTMTQLFTTCNLLEHMDNAAKALGVDLSKVKNKFYIIRNGYASPNYMKVNNNLPSIAQRSIDTIIEAQGVGDTYRIYEYIKDRGDDYNLAFIPPDLKPERGEMFDPIEMKRLFDRGYQDAVSGYKWHKAPIFIDIVKSCADPKKI